MKNRKIGNNNILGKNSVIQSNKNRIWQNKRNEYHSITYLTEWSLRSFEKTFDFSNAAIKSCLLINGGACIALLAFLGEIAQLETWKCSLHGILMTLLSCAWGCIFVVVCGFFSYLAQGKFTHMAEKILLREREKKSQCLENPKLEYEIEQIKNKGVIQNIYAIIFAGLSIVCFFTGCVIFIFTLWDSPIEETANDSVSEIFKSNELSSEEKIKFIKVLKK